MLTTAQEPAYYAVRRSGSRHLGAHGWRLWLLRSAHRTALVGITAVLALFVPYFAEVRPPQSAPRPPHPAHSYAASGRLALLQLLTQSSGGSAPGP